MLLLLDNCEHVIDAAASLAAAVLTAVPRVNILATSRVRACATIGPWSNAIGGSEFTGCQRV